jgi:hypothetical protein
MTRLPHESDQACGYWFKKYAYLYKYGGGSLAPGLTCTFGVTFNSGT